MIVMLFVKHISHGSNYYLTLGASYNTSYETSQDISSQVCESMSEGYMYFAVTSSTFQADARPTILSSSNILTWSTNASLPCSSTTHRVWLRTKNQNQLWRNEKQNGSIWWQRNKWIQSLAIFIKSFSIQQFSFAQHKTSTKHQLNFQQSEEYYKNGKTRLS